MIETLEDIKQALKKTVKVPYGVKPKFCRKRVKVPPFGSKVISYPCGSEPVYFRFKVWQVLTGPGKVIKPVMDLLNKEVDKILQTLLRKLNLNLNLKGIPGVEEIQALRNQLESTLNDAVDEFSRLMLNLEGPMGTFSQEMLKATSKMKEINDRCHLNVEEKL